MNRRTLLLLLCLQLPLAATWSLAGEALLLRPSLARPYTAIVTPNTNTTPLAGRWVGNTKPSYDWGYRVEAGYRRCCLDARVNWSSWIHTDPFTVSVDSNGTIFNTFAHPFFGIGTGQYSPGVLRRNDQYKMQAIDGDVGRWMEKCSWTARVYAGVRYTRIRYNVSIDIVNLPTTNAVTDLWESDVQGIGPRTGIEFSYRLCWGLRLFGNGSAALLLGTAKGRYLDFQNSGGTLILAESRMSPAHLAIANGEAHFGIGWCCGLIDAQVGYLINYFTQGTQRAQFFDDFAPGVSAVTLGSFALDGWNFRIGIRY